MEGQEAGDGTILVLVLLQGLQVRETLVETGTTVEVEGHGVLAEEAVPELLVETQVLVVQDLAGSVFSIPSLELQRITAVVEVEGVKRPKVRYHKVLEG
jgi:hypothetical protein